METSSDYGLDSHTRAVLQDRLDEYLSEREGPGELASPRPLHSTSAPPRAPANQFTGSAVVIDFRRARQHIEAARSMENAAPGAPPKTAESLRQFARDLRERARGYPPMRRSVGGRPQSPTDPLVRGWLNRGAIGSAHDLDGE